MTEQEITERVQQLEARISALEKKLEVKEVPRGLDKGWEWK